ncbi:MAG: hypothetical protein KatS3mg045_1608 [Bellilinea sp.]|nr:MAG: hypothetical protein KatS3mg045_1608 [Bellilinea sp.]
MNAWLERLVALESEVEYHTPPRRGEGEFRFQPGSLPVLISAPHGAAHTRHGRLKEEDDFTAGMARLCAELSGAHVLYAWRKSSTDPNYYPDVPYKQSLREIVRHYDIRFVLDLHGCAAYRDFGIALGSMHGQSLPREFRRLILNVLYRHGFRASGGWLSRVDVDRTFTAGNGGRQETITRFVSQRLGVAAVQIELNSYLRVVRRLPQASERNPFEGDPLMIERTIQLLVGMVRAAARFTGSDGFAGNSPTKL